MDRDEAAENIGSVRRHRKWRPDSQVAESVEEYWANLKAGVPSITFFSHSELETAGIPKSLLTDPEYVRAKGVLRDPEKLRREFLWLLPAGRRSIWTHNSASFLNAHGTRSRMRAMIRSACLGWSVSLAAHV